MQIPCVRHRLLSMTQRRSPKVAERDAKIEAIAALSLGEFLNINQAAKHFKFEYTTLKRRVNSGKSIADRIL
jgi:hypothetical protein